MEKMVKVIVPEAMNLYNEGDERVLNMTEALKGTFNDKPFRLSYAGVLHKNNGSHTEVDILNQELFHRFSKAAHGAQKQFLEGVEGWIEREKTPILIEALWGPEGKTKIICASIQIAPGSRRLVFGLA